MRGRLELLGLRVRRQSRTVTSPLGGREEEETRSAHHLFAVIEPFCLKAFFFTFESVELLQNVGVNEVGNVLTIHDLGYDVHLPFRIREEVILC